ncbi:uncharacterized protein TM35_000074900 [Trypanosoma theileri]|uniref:Uncharacterized protein n=1 Tax=Trypanosoma theileri TaxID=67003 RepID=A0A1X0P295_9TRYP|nr:uncharacterized protein TM35_000074900 [Trypanosoma theileri]ORC91066.1 hypothetical protein TM35_000074900 [Trypanosoma theileri]
MYSTLPDRLAEDYRLAVAVSGVHDNSKQDMNVNANINVEGNSYGNSSNCLIVSPTGRTPQRSTVTQSISPIHFRENTVDIYANDMMYLRTFDNEQSGLSRGFPSPLEQKAVSESPHFQHSSPSPLVTQLRKSLEDYAEEVTTLRRRLDEEERVCMEKDLALVELEERMINMRVRMMEALSIYRKSHFT